MVLKKTLRVAHLGSLTQLTSSKSRTEIDNHADTTVVGAKTSLVIQYFECPVHVYSYDGLPNKEEHCIVSAVAAYNHPETSEVFMLTFHQAILTMSFSYVYL